MSGRPTYRLPESIFLGDIGVDSLDIEWVGGHASAGLRHAFEQAGLREGESADVLSLSPGAIATSAAIRAFMAVSSAVDGDVVGVLEGESGAWASYGALGSPARLLRLRGGGELSPQRLVQATEVVIPVKKPRTVPVPLATVPGGGAAELVLADEVLCSTQTHAGILWANLLALPSTLWARLLGRSPWVAMLRLGWGVIRARSLNPFAIAARLSHVERGARVHPSAVVEGSWIQSGAFVDAGAVVRGSIIGKDARVEAMSQVNFSVMGEGSCVQRAGWMSYSVLHAGAAHAGAMQLGVLGPRAMVKGVSVLMDQGVGKPVQLRRDGVLYDVPLGIMGVGVGAGSVVGSGVWVGPGRVIPPGVTVLPPAASVLLRVDERLEAGVYQMVEGALRRVR